MVTTLDATAIGRAVAAVTDPEIRVVTIEELGILRGVETRPSGHVVVTITPTYSGCPAMDVIRSDVIAAALAAGARDGDVEVKTTLSPPWGTDRITAAGRAKLAAAGIAPPMPAGSLARSGRNPVPRPVPVRIGRRPEPAPPCPRCGALDTTELSRFGSTACKSLWRCDSCGEPFDHIKGF